MSKITEEIKTVIRKDREAGGSTLYDLAKKYGFSKSSIFNIIKDCNDSNVTKSSPSRKVIETVTSVERPKLSKTDIGEASRQMIIARLMFNTVTVFKPMTEDTPTDLLILKKDGKILKCQCKYIYPAEKGNHILPLCSVRKNGPGDKAVKHIYTKDEVDYFLGYCLDNDSVYVIPLSSCNGRSCLSLWILREPSEERYKNEVEQYRNNFEDLK